MKKSAELCIYENDLDSAFSRYENTNKRWKNYWYETCLTIFNKSKKWANKYIIDTVNKTIAKIKTSVSSQKILWNTFKEEYKKGTQLCYLIELLGKNYNLMYSKIGTTTRSIDQRMKEHLRYYAKEGVEYIRINKVWDCGEIDAEGFESYFRSVMIKKHHEAFKKNDRFIAMAIPIEYAEELFAQYQAIQGAKLAPLLPGPKIQFKYNLGVDILLNLWYYKYRKKERRK